MLLIHIDQTHQISNRGWDWLSPIGTDVGETDQILNVLGNGIQHCQTSGRHQQQTHAESSSTDASQREKNNAAPIPLWKYQSDAWQGWRTVLDWNSSISLHHDLPGEPAIYLPTVDGQKKKTEMLMGAQEGSLYRKNRRVGSGVQVKYRNGAWGLVVLPGQAGSGLLLEEEVSN